jgi:hypothetical protein
VQAQLGAVPVTSKTIGQIPPLIVGNGSLIVGEFFPPPALDPLSELPASFESCTAGPALKALVP